MQTALFASATEIFTGLLSGIVFGFLLRKGYLTRFATIVNQLRLKDFTVMKVMMTALIFSSFVFVLLGLDPSISETTALSAAIGGLLFGIGMAILGYCPGTSVGALADGGKDVWFGILGMILGAGLYAEAFPYIQSTIKPAKELMKLSLADYFSISSWTIVIPLAIGYTTFLLIANSLKRKKAPHR